MGGRRQRKKGGEDVRTESKDCEFECLVLKRRKYIETAPYFVSRLMKYHSESRIEVWMNAQIHSLKTTATTINQRDKNKNDARQHRV